MIVATTPPPTWFVLHPIVVHFAPVIWLAIAVILALRITQDEPSPFTPRWLGLLAWLATLAAVGAGLWDEDPARLHLARPWMLDDHRFAGLVSAACATVAALGLARRAPRINTLQRVMDFAMALLPTAAVWITVWLGHGTIHSSPWKP